ncbi:MAG: SRPBCC family protein [Thermoplasmatota archaeon]
MATMTVTGSQHVRADPEAVWAAMADFGGVHHWSSALVATRLDGPVAPGVRRQCDLARPVLGTRYVEERLVELDEGAGSLTYEVVGSIGPFKTARNQWRMASTPEGGVRITTQATFELRGLLGRLVAPWARRTVQKEIRVGLADFARHVEASA